MRIVGEAPSHRELAQAFLFDRADLVAYEVEPREMAARSECRSG